MNRRLLVIVAFSALVGLVASFLVFRVVSQVQTSRDQETEAIVVATANLGLAETITSQHIRLVRWPKRSVPPGPSLPSPRPRDEWCGHRFWRASR